ncbi:hypothetical protein GLX27_001503 [Malassezia furfur]|uniref:Mediator of RNA polymerase II transcription subunit 4 n=1 Tax=Malassezia furfur TaxID=55194 RepID=A0ABY8EMT9_MALFU|nr:hypothetical protein CBS14141_000833 [Malassezia furfur]WFD46861.1 hypothetical protein GLX27_001503 [Malassezia furfur]
MGTLQAELGGVLGALRTHAQSLFDELARNAALDQHGADETDAIGEHLAALASLEASLPTTLGLAAAHQANQARLDPLLQRIKERDTLQRDSIAQIASLRSELQALLDAADAERDEMQRAEDEPLSPTAVLAYAQRLARYTSAPPGYRLQPDPQAPKGDDHAQRLAPDYNPHATRAAGYYDPAIPTMPQELPFPSDRLMRQGILYADAAGGVLQPEPGGAPAEAAAAAASGMDVEPPAPAPAALESYAMDDDDAFDLDLNP